MSKKSNFARDILKETEMFAGASSLDGILLLLLVLLLLLLLLFLICILLLLPPPSPPCLLVQRIPASS